MVPEVTETGEIVSGYVAAHELEKLVHSEALLLLGPDLGIERLVRNKSGIKVHTFVCTNQYTTQLPCM